MSDNCSVLSDSLQSPGLWPARLLCPWDSPGKNAGMGCHFLLQNEQSSGSNSTSRLAPSPSLVSLTSGRSVVHPATSLPALNTVPLRLCFWDEPITGSIQPASGLRWSHRRWDTDQQPGPTGSSRVTSGGLAPPPHLQTPPSALIGAPGGGQHAGVAAAPPGKCGRPETRSQKAALTRASAALETPRTPLLLQASILALRRALGKGRCVGGWAWLLSAQVGGWGRLSCFPEKGLSVASSAPGPPLLPGQQHPLLSAQ